MSVNKVILMGRIGQNPEIKYGQSGNAVTKFSIATSDQWTDKVSGQKQEKTEWHNVKAFGKLAEFVDKFFQKGKPIYIEGSLTTSSYEKDGVKKYITEVIAKNISFVPSSGDEKENKNPQNQPKMQNFEQVQTNASFATDDIPF